MNQENIDVLTISTLLEEVAAAKVCCAQKEEELQHLREQTAELVAAQLAEDGADEDYVRAAKTMWLQAPHSVSQAIGIEVLKGANPYGCNQYGEGWAGEHNGKRSTPGKPVKKGEQNDYIIAPKKKEDLKQPEEKTPLPIGKATTRE